MSHYGNFEILDNWFEEGKELAHIGQVKDEEVEDFAHSFVQYMIEEYQF